MANNSLELAVKSLKNQAFGKSGRGVVQRSIEYLRRCQVAFREDVESLQLNLVEGRIHDYHITDRSILGARRFLFQNVPQLRFKNPQTPFKFTAEEALPPGIKISYVDGSETFIDICNKQPSAILAELISHTTNQDKALHDAEVTSANGGNVEDEQR